VTRAAWLNRAAAAAAIAGSAVAVYAKSAGYGLFADDYQWLVAAQQFDRNELFSVAARNHFFRPGMDAYFAGAFAVCDRSASCYHWLNIALHALASVAVAGAAAAIARRGWIGIVSGLLFALQSGPTEAVVWVSAATELLATLFFVLAVWLFHRHSWIGLPAFILSLVSHESGVMVVPVLALLVRIERRRWRDLAPYLAVLALYAPIAIAVSARNYVVGEGQYGAGAHVLSNIAQALGAFAATGASLAGMIATGIVVVWAIVFGSPRLRFYAFWMVLALLPFAGFREGFASRYMYLGAVGFSCLVAELLWSAREKWGLTPFFILCTLLVARSAAFASKNVRPWQDAARPYAEYERMMRSSHPAPPPGATIDVPRPRDFQPHYVPALLQWAYDDLTLRVNVID